MLDINEMSDWSEAEIDSRRLGVIDDLEHEIERQRKPLVGADIREYFRKGYPYSLNPMPGLEVPPSLDWRDHSAVTPVLDQGFCGSCWAFTATGILEGAYAIATGNQPNHLSVQQIIDCVNVKSDMSYYRSKGCRGGHTWEALEFAMDNYVNEATKYPYRERRKKCR